MKKSGSSSILWYLYCKFIGNDMYVRGTLTMTIAILRIFKLIAHVPFTRFSLYKCPFLSKTRSAWRFRRDVSKPLDRPIGAKRSFVLLVLIGQSNVSKRCIGNIFFLCTMCKKKKNALFYS